MSRPKGSKNKHSFNAEEIANQYEMQPLDFMLAVVNNDWKKLGYDSPTKISYSPAGIEFEEDRILLAHRVKCAESANKYLYSAKQTVEIKNPEGSEGFKIIVCEYVAKKK